MWEALHATPNVSMQLSCFRTAAGSRLYPLFGCRLSDEGTDAGVCRSSVLRVLTRLVRAADREPALRPGVGSPALWCGVDLLKNMDGCRAAWEADHDSQAGAAL